MKQLKEEGKPLILSQGQYKKLKVDDYISKAIEIDLMSEDSNERKSVIGHEGHVSTQINYEAVSKNNLKNFTQKMK